jgi:asparagine synthase (glutamine-hydrolysing)
MVQRIAGIFDPRRAGVEPPRALFDRMGAYLGPLILRRGAAVWHDDGEVLCALDGQLYAPDVLARALGEPPGRPLEALAAAAWKRFGERALNALRGDYALILWDHASRRGLVACDHLGARTLCYATASDSLVFGSEVRDVLALLSRRPDPDEAALSHWLAGGGPPDGRTLYAGIRRLLGGRCLQLSEDGWSETTWWRPEYRPPARRPREEVVESLRGLLEMSVRKRTPHAGSTGVMLSGGLDSAAVVGIATAGGARRGMRAYSAVFPNHPAVDERALIDRVVDSLGLHSVRIEADVGPLLVGSLDYLQTWQLPPSSPNLFFWLPLLRRAADDGIGVLLDGEGGDELFGVARWLVADRVRRGRVLAGLRLARRFPGAGNHPPWRPALEIMRTYGLRGALPAPLHAAVRRGRGSRRYAPPWLTERMARSYVESHDPWAWKADAGPRWWVGLLEALTNTEGAVLARDHVRRRSELAGLEARHPLCDIDLVEFMLGVDPEEAYDAHLSRPLLRESIRGLVPEEVRLRPRKSTFDAVFQRSLAGPSRSAFIRLLSAPDVEIRRYTDADQVRSMVLAPAPARGRVAWSIGLWRLATAECWLRSQSGFELPARLAGDWETFPMVDRTPEARAQRAGTGKPRV